MPIFVSTYASPYPQITYRFQSLRDQLVHSHLTTKSEHHVRKSTGTRSCGKCNFCRYMMNVRQIMLPNGETYKPNFYADCQTISVVYYMEWECKAFYVGKTKRPFFHRVRDHMSLVSKKKWETPISQHMGLLP